MSNGVRYLRAATSAGDAKETTLKRPSGVLTENMLGPEGCIQFESRSIAIAKARTSTGSNLSGFAVNRYFERSWARIETFGITVLSHYGPRFGSEVTLSAWRPERLQEAPGWSLEEVSDWRNDSGLSGWSRKKATWNRGHVVREWLHLVPRFLAGRYFYSPPLELF